MADQVIIGVDPHKLSVTFEASDSREMLRATGRFGTDASGYRLLVAYARQWPDRVWAVEGANGIGRPLAQRLLASGERVLDVPAKLAARARVFDTGQGRKTDPADAHAIVMVALRDKKLRELTADPDLTVLRLLCDRRDELSRARAQALNRMHRLFLELIPGGAPVKKSTAQYQALLVTVRPRGLAGKTRRRMAAEELADIGRLDAKLKAMKAELKTAVQATGSHLMDIHGIGPAGGARILADVGDVARFPDRGHFASWTGTAPIDASSGQHIRHRLSRAGNRRMNHVALPGRHRPAPQRHSWPRLPPASGRGGENPDGSDALPAGRQAIVDVTVEARNDADDPRLVKLQGETWELNIWAATGELCKLAGIEKTDWAQRRTLKVGTCANAPVWWNEQDGTVYILVGNDDESWDMCVTIPLGTVHQLLGELGEPPRVTPPSLGPALF